MDADFTPSTATGLTSAVLGAIAVDSYSGAVWVTDVGTAAGADGKVYQMSKDGNTLVNTYVLPKASGVTRSPSYLALEDDGAKVAGVWVSDITGGAIFRITPKTTADSAAPSDVVAVDVSSVAGFVPGPLAWDLKGKQIWVVDAGNKTLLPVSNATLPVVGAGVPLASPTDTSPAAIAVAADKSVWYADYGNGTIGVLPQGTGAVKSWTLDVFDSGPSGLAIDNTSSTVWVTTREEGALWKCGSVPPTSGRPKLTQVYKFASDQQKPRNIALDSQGYLWIADVGVPAVYEFSKDGALVHTYKADVGLQLSLAVANKKINPDLVWVADSSVAGHLYALTPQDQLVTGGDPDKDWTITATPPSGGAKPGDLFPPWVVTTKLNGNATPRSVSLIVTGSPDVYFTSSGTPATGVSTVGGSATITVSDLQADAAATENSIITVYARTRGWTSLKPIYTGLIGQPATKITAYEDDAESVHKGALFPHTLKVTVEPKGASVAMSFPNTGAGVATDATFSGTSSNTVIAKSDATTGIAQAALLAGAVVGTATVTVLPAVGTLTGVPLALRTVTEVPVKFDTFTKPASFKANTKDQTTPFSIRLVDASNKPVAGVWVQVFLSSNQQALNLYDRTDPANSAASPTQPLPFNGVQIQTNAQGLVTLSSASDQYFIYGPATIGVHLLFVVYDSTLGHEKEVLAGETVAL